MDENQNKSESSKETSVDKQDKIMRNKSAL